MVFENDLRIFPRLPENLSLNFRAGDMRHSDREVIPFCPKENFIKHDNAARVREKLLNLQFFAFGNLVLFPAGLDDCA